MASEPSRCEHGSPSCTPCRTSKRTATRRARSLGLVPPAPPRKPTQVEIATSVDDAAYRVVCAAKRERLEAQRRDAYARLRKLGRVGEVAAALQRQITLLTERINMLEQNETTTTDNDSTTTEAEAEAENETAPKRAVMRMGATMGASVGDIEHTDESEIQP